MLYDPRWDKHLKAATLSIDSLIAWLETQDPATEYTYRRIDDCLICRMVKSLGYPKARVGSTMVWLRTSGMDDADIPLPRQMDDIAGQYPHTYGAALTRARAVVSGAQ